MATLETLARDYAAAHPKRDGGTWSGWCASLMYRFNDAAQSYSNATAAGDAAGWLNPDPTTAPIGALHYWAGANGDGHVAQEVGGRGRKLFMASSKVDEALGTAIGFVSFDAYQSKAGLPYRGWALTYGVNPAIGGDDSGQFGDPAPAPTPEPAPVPGERTRTIVEGDTLWDIAVAEYGDGNRYPDIFNATQASSHPLRSGNADLIYPGEIITLP